MQIKINQFCGYIYYIQVSKNKRNYGEENTIGYLNAIGGKLKSFLNLHSKLVKFKGKVVLYCRAF